MVQIGGPSLLKILRADKESNAEKDGSIIWTLRYPRTNGQTMRSGFCSYSTNSMATNGQCLLNSLREELTTQLRTIGTLSWNASLENLKNNFPKPCPKKNTFLTTIKTLLDCYLAKYPRDNSTIKTAKKAAKKTMMIFLKKPTFLSSLKTLQFRVQIQKLKQFKKLNKFLCLK